MIKQQLKQKAGVHFTFTKFIVKNTGILAPLIPDWS